jgi:hypothetical protein
VKDQLRFVDTAQDPSAFPPGAIVKHSALAIVAFGPQGSRFVAPLDDLSPTRRRPPAPFDEWWREPVVTENLGNAFARSDLALGLVHKEGGAHFDPELERAYAALTRDNSLGWRVHGPAGELRLDSPVPANARQIGWELQTTIEEQLSELL